MTNYQEASVKSWSYRQITEKTEESIRQSMRLAAEAAAKGDNETRHVHRCMAKGAYLAWSNLTMGWQIDDADARLEALTKAPADQPGAKS